MRKGQRLKTVAPRVVATTASRVRTLTRTAGATPRLNDRSGGAWAVIRRRILARDPLCVDCLAATPQHVSVSREVDHRIPLERGGSDDDANLAGVCVPCHRAKSARERSEAARG